jgi:hypothetical protein
MTGFRDEQTIRRSDRSRTDAQGFLGFVVLGSILYFTVVLRLLPNSTVRCVVTAVLTATVVATWSAAKRWDWVERKLPVFRQQSLAAYDFLIFVLVLVVAVVVLATMSLATEDRVLLLKVFAVAHFWLLSALLYRHFSSRRTLAGWRDYVLQPVQATRGRFGDLPRPPMM